VSQTCTDVNMIFKTSLEMSPNLKILIWPGIKYLESSFKQQQLNEQDHPGLEGTRTTLKF